MMKKRYKGAISYRTDIGRVRIQDLVRSAGHLFQDSPQEMIISCL